MKLPPSIHVTHLSCDRSHRRCGHNEHPGLISSVRVEFMLLLFILEHVRTSTFGITITTTVENGNCHSCCKQVTMMTQGRMLCWDQTESMTKKLLHGYVALISSQAWRTCTFAITTTDENVDCRFFCCKQVTMMTQCLMLCSLRSDRKKKLKIKLKTIMCFIKVKFLENRKLLHAVLY